MRTAQAKGGWTPPRLARAELAEFASAAQAWTLGQTAEAAFDFERARSCYLAAVALSPGAAALAATLRYAEFLVDRLGDAAEVAGWLDDAGFAPPTDPKGPGRALAILIGVAAGEVGHPRAPALDAALAAQGDPKALVRQAKRALASGDLQLAYRTLADAEAKHAADPGYLAFFDKLKKQRNQQAQAELSPVAASLDALDVDTAGRLLTQSRATWGTTPAWSALDQRRTALAQRLHAESLRARLDTLADAGNWQAAVDLAGELVAQPGATPADRAWLAHAQTQAAARETARLRAAAEAAPAAERWPLLAQLAAAAGPEDQLLRGAAADLQAQWETVLEAASLSRPQPLGQLLAALPALHALRQMGATPDPEQAQPLLDRLPAQWRQGPTAKAATAVVQSLQAELQVAEENAFVEAVQLMIDHNELEDATLALTQWSRTHVQLSAQIKSLRSDLQAARLVLERRHRLHRDFDAALHRGAYFHARHILSELSHLEPADQVAMAASRLDAAAGPALRGVGMPPGAQKLSPGAIASAVVNGRLVVAQERTWMSVVLDTLGLQPFALPEGWPIEVAAGTRIGAVGQGVRLLGLSRGRLLVVDQAPGEAPHVQSAIDLSTALRGDDLLIGSALEPDAKRFVLLSRHSQRGPAATWTCLDAATLEVISHKKTLPNLASAVAVQHLPDRLLVAVHSRDRQSAKSHAVALVDGDNKPIFTLSDQEIGEWVAGFRTAIAWPEQERIFARFLHLDPFDPNQTRDEPSLLVLRQGRVVFASTDLRRRFAPQERLTIDHAWTLDPVAGRLWFSALPPQGGGSAEALLLGVDARTLRPDPAVTIAGAERILSLMPIAEGAVALCKMQQGHFSLVRALWAGGRLELTAHRLPL